MGDGPRAPAAGLRRDCYGAALRLVCVYLVRLGIGRLKAGYEGHSCAYSGWVGGAVCLAAMELLATPCHTLVSLSLCV